MNACKQLQLINKDENRQSTKSVSPLHLRQEGQQSGFQVGVRVSQCRCQSALSLDSPSFPPAKVSSFINDDNCLGSVGHSIQVTEVPGSSSTKLIKAERKIQNLKTESRKMMEVECPFIFNHGRYRKQVEIDAYSSTPESR
jgi:hypothetical protein